VIEPSTDAESNDDESEGESDDVVDEPLFSASFNLLN
jgi:hypothetical protein